MGFRFRRAAVAGMALLASIFPSSNSRSYDAGSINDPNMHPVITSEAVRAHNQTVPSLELRIDEDSKNRMLEGSINEDDYFPRYLHHFNPGIWGFSSADVWATSPEEQTGPIVAVERVPEEAQSFYGELLNQCQCLNYVGGDQSWQQAVEELRIRGKPSNALGHILHLIEDMTMPAHVRGDVHILRAISVEIDSEGIGLSRIGDFHEYMTSVHLEWMNEVQAYNVGEFNSIEDLFDDVASFTRNHFYSDDTLLSNDELASKYDMERVGRKTYFVDEIDGNKVFVARKGWLGPIIDERCSESMAAVLLPRAVGYAQATIKLAYKEAGLWPNTGCNTLAAECVGNSVEQYDDCGNLIRKEDCGPDQYCDNARCIDDIICNCSGKECGDDGCGNSCGDCNSDENCQDNQCIPKEPTCTPNAELRCTSNDVYSYDSCGNLERKVEDCDYGCSDRECLPGSGDYLDNEDGTISDINTKLMWEKFPLDTRKVWDDAINLCENLNLGGYSDWHLPIIDELRTLVRGCPPLMPNGQCNITDQCESCEDIYVTMYCSSEQNSCGPSGGPGYAGCYLDPFFDLDHPSYDRICDSFWSSSDFPSDYPSWAWVINFNEGGISAEFTSNSEAYRTWCVREE